MKKVLLIIFACLLMLFILFQISGSVCEPPDFQSVYSDFEYYKQDILLVLNYLIDSNYENVYFIKETGEMVADFRRIEVNEEPVVEAILRLFDSGRFINVSKIGGTIEFEMWNGIRDVGCGVAYSMDSNKYPDIQFQTELLALPESGWYYYIYDYDKWRSNR